jgi:hypothetical protein
MYLPKRADRTYLEIICGRPKLELLRGSDFEVGKVGVENYERIASAVEKEIW